MLEPGQSLSHYRLVEKIGAGGMGVVWSAEDTVLKRPVAIKVLPEAFSRDPERLGRFQREARALAALNHPNISAIHGLEQADGMHFLVLELVPGESLAERLVRGPLPVPEVLRVCGDVARGLEAAHGQGVLHRDLKPGNIMITPQGQAKVLDFGLAKALAGPGEVADSRATTELFAGTREHVVMGTAPYMSPEQASGHAVDRRVDVWAWGCVMYEALTGRQAFAGDTVSQTFAAIQGQEPDWERLPVDLPPRVGALLRRCLEKEPDRRLRDLGDAWLEIDDARSGAHLGPAEAALRPQPRWRAAAAGIALLAVGTAGGIGIADWVSARRDDAAGAAVVRFSIDAPAGMNMGRYVRASPDGAYLLYTAHDPSAEDFARRDRLYLHSLERGTSVQVQGSDGVRHAAFSPDGGWVAFTALPPPPRTRRQIYKVPVDGSAPPLALMEQPENLTGSLAWLSENELVGLVDGYGVFDQRAKALRIPADGSAPAPPIPVDPGDQEVDFFGAVALPGGRHILADVTPTTWGTQAVIDVETGEARVLTEVRHGDVVHPSTVRWSPTGHLVLMHRGTVMAMPFDADRLAVTGGATVVSDGIGAWDLSASGTLAYYPSEPERERYFVLYSESEGEERWPDQSACLPRTRLVVSGDGSTMAVTCINPDTGFFEVWTSAVARPALRPIAKVANRDCTGSSLSHDGRLLVTACYSEVGSYDDEGLYLHRTDGTGTAERLVMNDERSSVTAGSFTPDGRWFVFARRYHEADRLTFFRLSLQDRERPPEPLEASLGDDPHRVRFSRDGRWVAYSSKATGTPHVYLRQVGEDLSFGPEILVTPRPAWGTAWGRTAEDGRQALVTMRGSFWVSPDGAVSEIEESGESDLSGDFWSADVLPDGRLLALLRERPPEGAEERRTLQVVLNWTGELRRKLDAAG